MAIWTELSNRQKAVVKFNTIDDNLLECVIVLGSKVKSFPNSKCSVVFYFLLFHCITFGLHDPVLCLSIFLQWSLST